MKINIVTYSPREWVLGMMAKNWCKYLPNCSITDRVPDPTADINYYVNWALFNSELKTKI